MAELYRLPAGITGKREKESGNFTEPIFGVRLQALNIIIPIMLPIQRIMWIMKAFSLLCVTLFERDNTCKMQDIINN